MWHVYAHVCVYVYVCECMYAYVFVWNECVWGVYVCVFVCMCICLCVFVWIFAHGCVCAWMCVCMECVFVRVMYTYMCRYVYGMCVISCSPYTEVLRFQRLL